MIMGMPISIDIPDVIDAHAFEQLFDLFKQIDQQFSPYIESSEVALFSNGTLQEGALSNSMKATIKACEHYETLTDGYFSAYYNGSFDPSGYIKAWAMQEASEALIAQGITTFLINIAGDMVAHGDAKTWRIGIQDPFNKQATLGIVALTNQAIATSGSYVRGAHIFDPHTKSSKTDLISVSIYGPDIIKADVFATACTAMGFDKATTYLQAYPDYAALLIKTDDTVQPVNNFVFS